MYQVEDRDIEFSNGIFESIWTESGLGLDKSADIFGWGSCDVSSSSQAMVSRLRKIKVKILPNSFCDREPIKTSLEFENSKFKMCAKIVNEMATAIPTEVIYLVFLMSLCFNLSISLKSQNPSS